MFSNLFRFGTRPARPSAWQDWIANAIRGPEHRRARHKGRAALLGRRLRCEPLEERRLLSLNPVTTGLSLWLEANAGVTTDGSGGVSAWADQSGAGHSASQPVANDRPVLVLNAINGNPSLSFDGTGDFLNLGGQVLNSQQFTIIAVGDDTRNGSDTSYREILSNWEYSNETSSVFLGTANQNPVHARFTDAMGGAIDPNNNHEGVGDLSNPADPFIVTGVSAVSDATIYQNTALLADNGSPIPTRNLTSSYYLGTQGDINGEFWQGDIAEVLVYNTALTASELQQDWAYLAGKYDLAAPTTTTIVSAPTITYGQNGVVTATVSSLNSLPPDGLTLTAAGGTATETGTSTSSANGLYTRTDVFNVTGLACGDHSLTASFHDPAGNFGDSQSAGGNVTVSRATPTVTVSDAGGTYNSTSFPATGASVTGVGSDGTIASFGDPSLSYVYYQNGALLAGTPTNAGSYAVVAEYAGSANYVAADSAEVAAPGSPGDPLGNLTNDGDSRSKAGFVLEVGKSMADVTAIDILDLHSYDGPGGSNIVAAPAGSPYSYLIRNQNDGQGHDVTLGVVEATGFTIGKAPLPVSAGNDSQSEGAPANLGQDLGTIIATGVNGENLTVAYSSTGDTAMAEEGTYLITATFTDGSGLLSNYNVTFTSGTLTVNDAPLTATATPISAVEGQPLTNVQVATFTDANPVALLSDFPLTNVTINWGDGSSSNATAITQPGGVGTPFYVFGSHTYAEEGVSTVSVVIQDIGGATSDFNTISAGAVSTFASGVNSPHGLAFDGSGNLYAVDSGDGTISKVSTGGGVSTFASGFTSPVGLAFDTAGNLYVSYGANAGTIGKVTLSGAVSVFADYNTGLYYPEGLAFDNSGNLYVANWPSGAVIEFAPSGAPSASQFNLGGYGASALAFDAAGNLYVANPWGGTVNEVSPAGEISSFATGFNDPEGLAFDSSGNLYVTNARANTVSMVTPGGIVSTFISSGLDQPEGLAFDSSGNLYVANAGNGTVTEIPIVKTPTPITTIATVADAPLTATGTAVSATEGAALSNVQVATLTDAAGTYSNPGDLSATITWGDGTMAAPATLVEVGTSGVYTVEGSHTYTEYGSYTIGVNYSDEGGSTTTSTSTATVADAPLTATATLASFNGTNGAAPHGGLIEDSNGDLFGTTIVGTPGSAGAVFEVVAGSHTITTLATFNGINGTDPQAGLVEDSSGDLFGTTAAGGPGGGGTVFDVAAGSGTISTVASFSGANGVSPQGGLIEDSNGDLFGTTAAGGSGGGGTVFEVVAGSGTITTLASFNGINGVVPQGGLVEDSSGDLFGTTAAGGSGGGGTVFEVVAGSGTITTLASFNGINGVGPQGGLVEDSSGDLFGTTAAGGPGGNGTVFEVAAGSGTITTLAAFDGTNGVNPQGDLVEDSSGDLFGTTIGGGPGGNGTVFEVAAGSGTIATLASFNGSNGAAPLGGLLKDSSGNFFGTTAGGGPGGRGTVFEVQTAHLTPPVATENQAFSNQTVFHFTDADPNGTASDYTAVINLGDGNSVTLNSNGVVNGPAGAGGQIVADGDGFDVQLSYTYAEELSNQTFSVTVTDVGGASTSASINTFNVADAPLTSGTLTASGGVEGVTPTTLSATFTDANAGAPTSDFSGTINWGDGTAGNPDITTFTSSAVTGSDGSYTVSASHQYAEESGQTPYAITVTINDVGGSTTADSGTTTVADAPLTAGALTPPVGSGSPSISTFADSTRGIAIPQGLAFDTSGNLYVALGDANAIDKVAPDGTVTTFADSGLDNPFGLAFDAQGNLYAANLYGGTISKITPQGAISTFASGLDAPAGLAFDASGNLYVSLISSVVEITPAGAMSTVASGFNNPAGALAFDADGNLFVAVGSASTIDEITPSGAVSVFADSSQGIDNPVGLAFDANGNLYVANQTSNTIVELTPAGAATTLVGGSGGLQRAYFAAFDNRGNLYVSNHDGNTVSKIVLPPPVEGQAFSNVTVFHFSDADPNGTAGDYTAVVTLGDGNTLTLTSTRSANGQIVANPGGGFDVQLSCTYVDELSNATFGASVTDAGGASTGASTTFSVADAPLTSGTLTASGGVEGVTPTTLSATFTDANAGAPTSDFSGTINWGDGTAGNPDITTFTSSAVTGSDGSYTVTGSHQYAELGTYGITVTVNDAGGSTTTDSGSTSVAEAPSLVVTTANDVVNPYDGVTSFREAVAYANSLPGGGTITFAPGLAGQTITLTNGDLALTNTTGKITIQGPGANELTIDGNSAFTVFVVDGGVTADISGLTMAHGYANMGGAIMNDGTLLVSNCAIRNNSASYGGGGIGNSGNLTVSDCTVSDNSASNNYGGGLYSFYGTVAISGSTFTGNSAGDGGGMCIVYANVAATDSTFGGNSSIQVGGGGIYNESSSLTLLNCTLSGNSAIAANVEGGGIANVYGGISTLTNTIVANSPSGGDLVGSSSSYSGNNDLIDDSSAGTNGSNGYFGASSLYNVAPGLDLNGLQDNGGTTQTIALLPGSAAIGAGDYADAPAADQRGVDRTGHADIGAFQSQGFSISVTSGNSQSTPILTAFVQPLVVTVSSAYGEPVAGGQVTFTAPGPGDSANLTGTPATIGSNGQASVTASANGAAGQNYSITASAAGAGSVGFSLSNLPATPSVSVEPVNITYGTALANGQLSGTAEWTASSSTVDVPGTFTYASAAGTVLAAGNGHIENVLFTPADRTDYNSVSSTATVNVGMATPVVTVNPVNIPTGTKLANSQLSGTASWTVNGQLVAVAGTFTYTTVAGLVLVGEHSEQVTFTPNDSTDYTTVNTTVMVNVGQLTLTVNPVSITYGTALANVQLSGTAKWTAGGQSVSVAGTFTYTSAAGTVLNASSSKQTETVTFTPSDSTDYAKASSTVTVTVGKATPTVTVNPVIITYGTALANAQLSGTATWTVNGSTVSVPGTFTYKSAAGTVLKASSSGQSEVATFTPSDSTDYATASSTVTVNVAQATPTLVTVNAVTITYGTALANSQLSGTANWTVNGGTVSVPGTLAYTSATGTVLNAGNAQSETVTFTPSDGTDYTTANSTVSVNVHQAAPTITSVSAVTISYGTALANSQLSGTVTWTVNGQSVGVPGTFTYTSAAGTVLKAGNGQKEPVTFAPSDSTDYTTASSTVTVNVGKATPTVTVNPVNIPNGTKLANSQLSGMTTWTVNGQSVNVPGTFSYTSAAGTLLAPGSVVNEAVTFKPTDSTDYNNASSTVTVTMGSPELAEGGLGQNLNATPLTASEATPLLHEAEVRWTAAGADVAALGRVQIRVVNLPGTELGEWSTVGADTIFLDTNAKSWGWFIDPTPAQDSAFPVRVAKTEDRAISGAAAGQMDLLTVIMHEMGHLLGYPDLNPQTAPYDLMSAELAPGIRRLPNALANQAGNAQMQATDALFASLVQPQGGTATNNKTAAEPQPWGLCWSVDS